MNAGWVYDRESFYDFLGFMIVYAPEFPNEDFLEDNEQLNLEAAFSELKKGVSLIRNSLSTNQIERANLLIDDSFDDFRNGNDKNAIQILQQLRTLLFNSQPRNPK